MNYFNRKLSFKSDLIVTALNGLTVIGGIFILNGLIARMMGLEVLGEFLLIKRTLTAIIGVLLLGMNISLPNFLSRNFEKSYIANSALLFVMITIPITIAFIYGVMCFNISGFNSNHFWLLILFSLSTSAQFITFALYRGYMNMVGANLIQLLGTVIIPIIIFSIINDLYVALFWMGAVNLLFMTSAFILRSGVLGFNNIQGSILIQIYKFGLSRVPSFLAQFILLAGIPMYLAQSLNFESVAYFNSSLSLVRLTLLIINPIGMVILPRLSNKIASGTTSEIPDLLRTIFHGGIIFSVMGAVYVYLFAPVILKLWLGSATDSGIFILRIAILALPFYTFSGLTQSPLEAISEKGYNSIIYGISAAVMIGIIMLGNTLKMNMLSTALISFLGSQLVAALSSAYYIRKLYHFKLFGKKLFRDTFWIMVIIFAAHKIIMILKFNSLVHFLVTSALMAVMIAIVLSKTRWLAEIKSKTYA